ncbi:hypothetical protein PPACK8108_LOCUS19634 [Phakopsora pachyrhizi]|uniref:RecQ mediated genome instability protein 1 N-terminal domain-containing protein n=1 Tax=Phakopsora pachyrhizi TaxID=170000 RepID=A0AAV0BGW8_PHAPC|nr:hypothetical protein PPACK8108_LOCUS19634 [Phakopsora pachyrhizi]
MPLPSKSSKILMPQSFGGRITFNLSPLIDSPSYMISQKVGGNLRSESPLQSPNSSCDLNQSTKRSSSRQGFQKFNISLVGSTLQEVEVVVTTALSDIKSLRGLTTLLNHIKTFISRLERLSTTEDLEDNSGLYRIGEKVYFCRILISQPLYSGFVVVQVNGKLLLMKECEELENKEQSMANLNASQSLERKEEQKISSSSNLIPQHSQASQSHLKCFSPILKGFNLQTIINGHQYSRIQTPDTRKASYQQNSFSG